MKRSIIIIICVLLLSSSLWGQEVEYVSSTLWTEINDVQVVSEYAYCAFHNGLVIIDISDPSAPILMKEYFLGGEASDIQIIGDFAYVADGGEGLQIIDISDPIRPDLVGSYDESRADMIFVSGNYAYAIYGMASPWGGDYRFLVIDITDPTAPYHVGSIQLHGAAYALSVIGDYAYVSDGAMGIQIFDVSDPTSPDTIGSFETPGYPWKVFAVGDYAYVADGPSGLTILDVSNPANPELVSNFPAIGDFRDIVVIDERAYIVDEGTYPFSGALRIINVSDRLNPYIEGSYFITGLTRLSVYGSYSNVLDAYGNLHIIDISDPYSPAYSGCYDTPRTITGVFVDDHHAFVTASHPNIFVIDVADPANPVYAGVSDTVGWSRDIQIVGDYAYLTGTGLQIVDISNPSHPASVGVYQTERYSRRVFVSNGFAYVTEYYGYNYDLEIVDVSDPANPYFVGGFDTLGSAGAICVAGDYAYVGVGYMGVIILDISDPSNPYAVGRFLEGQAAPGDIVIAGNLLYLTARDLQIFDISDPTSPTLIGRNDIPTIAGALHISQNHAYVADRFEGLWIFNIQDPENPNLAGSYHRFGTFDDVFVSGDYIYIAEDFSLLILHFHPQTGIIEEISEMPAQFSLSQNHPNPFNASTTIRYDLPLAGDVRLEIYDILGRKLETLIDGQQPAGAHSVVWDAEDVSSGVYFYRIEAGEYVESRSCLLLK